MSFALEMSFPPPDTVALAGRPLWYQPNRAR